MKKLKYIDLFSGIGGFHQAMNSFGGECVFSSEIDSYAIETYRKNYGINSDNDITKCNPENLDDYELLCAGFPCQAFSKAGKQLGFEDETKGTLFFEIERLLKHRVSIGNPVKYILLENVSNLDTHDHGNTIRTIKNHLHELGYILTERTIHMSPHQLGIPQLRSRVFILGVHRTFLTPNTRVLKFTQPNVVITKRNVTQIKNVLERRVSAEYCISEEQTRILDMWDEFYQIISKRTPVIGFPIWSEYFGEKISDYEEFPTWKKIFVEKNINLYNNNKEEIDIWLKKNNYLKDISPTHRKFEWQAGKDIKSIKEGIIQFRTSGIRVKRPTEAPALVAMVHIPIVYVAGRYRHLTVREVARLQSFPENFIPCEVKQQAYKQFGNSVNVKVVEYCLEQLFKY